MSDKITVLCVEKTGHVLAALTRAADAETEPTVEALAGEALLVRGIGDPTQSWYPDAHFLVPPDELKVKVVDSKPSAIENPRGFYLDENDELQTLDTTGSASNAAVAAGQLTFDVTGTAIVAAKAAVWVLITDLDPSRYQTLNGEKPAGAGAPALSLSVSPLGPGTHYALVLVAGIPPNAFEL